jgi:hypothetical protein
MGEAPATSHDTEQPRSRWSFLLRPWFLVTLTILAILVAIPLGYRSSRFAGIPPIDEVVDRETEGRIDIEPDQNAFTVYESAWQQIPPGLHDEPITDAIDALLTDGWSGVPPAIRGLLDTHRPILDEWKRGTELERGVAVQPADLEQLVHISAFDARLVCYLALLMSARCLEEGQPEEAWQWLLANLKFSRHLGNPGPITDRYCGIAFHAIISGHVAIWASHESVTTEHLKVALQDLREINRRTVANSVVFKCEYFQTLNLLSSPQRVQEYCRLSLPRGAILDGVPGPLSGSYLFLLGEPELCQLVLRHYYANILSQCDLPRQARTLSTVQGLFQPTGAESPPLIDPESLAVLLKRSQLASQLEPSMFLIEGDDRERARQALLETCLAVEMFRRRHGVYPDSLAALVPEFLDQVPQDPFGPAAADRLLMILRQPEALPPDADPPPTLPGLILYSRGHEGLDDGGTERPYKDLCVRIPIPHPGASQP